MKLLFHIIQGSSIFLIAVVLSFFISFGGISIIFENPVLQVLTASALFLMSIILIAYRGTNNREHSKRNSLIEITVYGAMTGFGGVAVYFLNNLRQLTLS